ncbi:biotin--[acetyl-CoA-carboxylase] ligase [Paenibacillus typhae]|uniref:biotin--[biotin carboxyl-carrier protein] ligase n=1 Tax=Paenibacillus typhae TaxID=1174501 RepID=A0A1G8PNC9_9BACL|nr:biotin--[acetyl-CoA-carboxylase] ligase [Paenibacillus typhae]SDI93983.1 BirA family transcriptional regulator, biotin operon repressor / biotin-[acetyl-CoA-carboxylase] ligase [Paenibacillus typhae]
MNHDKLAEPGLPARDSFVSGWQDRLHLLDSVVSTQEEAKKLAEAGAPEGTAVRAEEQTGGRGRMGRKWHSPKGKGIWMSIVLRPDLPLALTPQLTLLAGVAVCTAIREVTGVPAGIKWPNDLLAGGRKICGILLESCLREGGLHYAIAGIGISANLTPEDYPDYLQEVGTSLLIEGGGIPVDREQLTRAVLAELEYLYCLYLDQGFQPVKELWESMSVTLGRQISFRTAQGRSEGKAVGLDENGGLQLQDEAGNITSILSGEIEMI